MSQFIQVPVSRLEPDTLRGLLEEFASRDGTDYGAREISLSEKVEQLKLQLQRNEICLVFDQEGQDWDLLPADEAGELQQ